MAFRAAGRVEFRDTDAAGVVYFANLLAFCHRAYELSLQASQIDLRQFFSSKTLAFPITKTTLDLFQPLFPGDGYEVEMIPKLLSDHAFEISYRILPESRDPEFDPKVKPIGLAMTHHVCIDPQVRQRRPLPPEIRGWIERWGSAAA